MHLQPVFKDCLAYMNGTAEYLFKQGLCLPSGSKLSKDDLQRTVNVIISVLADT